MTEPVDLATAKAHCRVDGTDEDALIPNYIAAAREYCESETGMTLVADDEKVETFDRFTPALTLASWPIRGIVSITYLDTAGNEQTLDPSAWRLAAGKRPARLSPAVGTRWPATLGAWPAGFWGRDDCFDDGHRSRGVGAITVTVQAGYDDPADIPLGLRTAVLMMTDHYYRNRAPVETGDRAAAVDVPKTVDDLLDKYSLKRV